MKTPRTDAEVEAFSAPTGGSLVYSEFARKLERELNAADAEIAELRATCSQRYYQIEELTKLTCIANGSMI